MPRRALFLLGALAVLAACAASVADKQAALDPRQSFTAYSHCADEPGSCACSGDVVRYGAEGHWVYKLTEGETSFACTNDVFTDPIPGTVKRCECNAETWDECADEGGTCACEGDVRFGADERWNYRNSAGDIACTNDVFTDPLYGTRKKCFCKAAGWTRCADLNDVCQCSGTLRLAANGNYREVTLAEGTTELPCSDFYGMGATHCDCYEGFLQTKRQYHWCADEGGTCECPLGGSVRFGTDVSYSEIAFSEPTVACESASFGGFRPASGDPGCHCATWTTT